MRIVGKSMRNSSGRRAALVAAAFAMITGCGGKTTVVEGPLPAAQAASEYKIGPGDTLQVFVWNHPKLTVTVPVRPDGVISTPLIEGVPAAGAQVTVEGYQVRGMPPWAQGDDDNIDVFVTKATINGNALENPVDANYLVGPFGTNCLLRVQRRDRLARRCLDDGTSVVSAHGHHTRERAEAGEVELRSWCGRHSDPDLGHDRARDFGGGALRDDATAGRMAEILQGRTECSSAPQGEPADGYVA